MTSTQTYNRHELSTPFAEASPADFAILLNSIRDRGFDERHPIILYEGMILDGWHRWRACQELGIDPPFEEFEGDDEDAMAFVFSENIARRQMTEPQKATAYAIRNQFLEPKDQLSDVQIAALVGRQSVSKISQLRRLVEADPDIAQKVAAGEMKANTAIRETLSEIPEDAKKDTPVSGVFTVRRKALLRGIEEARKTLGWTPTRTGNKAFELFIEWAQKEREKASAT